MKPAEIAAYCASRGWNIGRTDEGLEIEVPYPNGEYDLFTVAVEEQGVCVTLHSEMHGGVEIDCGMLQCLAALCSKAAVEEALGALP